jgi:hypothetical protein
MALRYCLLAALLCWPAACKSEPDDREGAVCESAADCAGLACVGQSSANLDDLEALVLACSSEQQGRAAAHSCERSSQCASGICVLAGTCVEPCSDANDCGSLERCQSVYARGERGQLQTVNACVAMVSLPNAVNRDVEVRKHAFSGGEDTLSLRGANQTSLFVIEHLDDDTWPVPSPDTTCRPPLCTRTLKTNDSDGLWFDHDALDDPAGPINPVAVGDHVYPATVLIPNGPRASPSEAGYTLQVETKRAGDARITALFGNPGAGQLDLNLFYVGAEEFTEAGDEVPPTIASALEEVDRIFEPAGLFIGDLRQIHVTGALLERGSDLPDAEVSRGFTDIVEQYRVYPQLPELFKLSAGAGNAALDVFFVGEIDGQGEANVGAITGATPLPWGMHGTGSSGIAIAANPVAGDPQRLGRTLAHELGHALGLFHTTEVDGDVFDPLPDTPVCDRSRDRDRSGLDADDCAGAGADNLMFPTTNASAANLTEDQAAVIRNALILQ